jgi:hypothetical protein
MLTFEAGLCHMLNGNLTGPYEGVTIETHTVAEAINRAKFWAATIDVQENSWLQVLYNGKAVASLAPGEFDAPRP